MDSQTYEGWRNRETWNVALWINNDYQLYRDAVKFMKSPRTGHAAKSPYAAFIKSVHLYGTHTPDHVAYISPDLDYAELDAMMAELIEAGD